MSLLSMLFITAASAVMLLLHHASAAALVIHVDSSGPGRHAPPRPIDAPDVEYENHPFDQYRHLYDDNYRRLDNRERRLHPNDDAADGDNVETTNNDDENDDSDDNDAAGNPKRNAGGKLAALLARANRNNEEEEDDDHSSLPPPSPAHIF